MSTFFSTPLNLSAALLALLFGCSAPISQTEWNKEVPADGSSWDGKPQTAILNLAGICAVVRQDKETKQIMIVQVLPDGAAEKAGLQPKDSIVKIDGRSTEGMETMDAVSLLRGVPGTKVTVTVARESFSAPKDFVVTREEVKLKEVPSH